MLIPILSRESGDFQLGLFSFSDLGSRIGAPLRSTQHCPIMFGTEQSSVIEKRLMSEIFGGINPYGYKVWDDRINAFRVIASVDTVELASDQSEQIDGGAGMRSSPLSSELQSNMLIWAFRRKRLQSPRFVA